LSKLTVLDLFCGGGIGAMGLMQTGKFEIVQAIDRNRQAVESYNKNIGNHAIVADLTAMSIDDLADTDGIFGGPVCHTWSVAGKGEGDADIRGQLVWRYLEIVTYKKPKFFLFENVKGIIGKKHRPTFDRLLEEFKSLGYNVSWKLTNSWDYGVGQKRERVFIVGIRSDLGFTYEFPQPKQSDYRTQTLQSVIGDLPVPELQVNGGHLSNNYGTEYEMANRKESWDKPGATVTAHHRCSYTHPGEERRRFTVRECLRIQSVPDTYVFPDDLSLSAQYTIVGNGIPSKVIRYLVDSLAKQLNA
jgi:DNA (cytosine-5)-methyltransferase 1